MKKTTIIVLFLSVLVSSAYSAKAASNRTFAEFSSKTAQFISPAQRQRSANKPELKKSVTIAPKILGVVSPNGEYVKSLVVTTINQMLAQGLLKGEKGDKGDPSLLPTIDSVDPDSTDLRQVYMPGAVLAANQQTFLSATNLSGDSININTINTGDLDATGAFTSEGDAMFVGNVNFSASTTMGDLVVSSIESPVSIANFDGYSWTNSSSRELKENFTTTSPADILNKIDSLPIYSWNYKKDSPNVEHIGPVAEDFYNTFNLGNSSSSISTIDPAGVALAGIQGLNEKIKSVLDFNWALDELKQLGIEIQNGFVKVQKLTADFIFTKELEVGSPQQPTGITIYDRATGLPVCIYSENNSLKSEPGKCQVGIINAAPGQDLTSPAQTTVLAEDLAPHSTSTPETEAITTPDIKVATSPDLTLSNP